MQPLQQASPQINQWYQNFNPLSQRAPRKSVPFGVAMKLLLLCLFILAFPARAAMDVTRELVVPDQLVPGQPLRVAITFWTDSWFNPPPQWPDFPSKWHLLPTPIP